VVVTIVIGYISKNIIEKKLQEQEAQHRDLEHQNSKQEKYYLRGMSAQNS